MMQMWDVSLQHTNKRQNMCQYSALNRQDFKFQPGSRLGAQNIRGSHLNSPRG